MPAVSHLPTTEEVSKFFSDLLGVQVTTEECTDFAHDQTNVFAHFTDADNATRHFVACDISGGAILGAALTGFPPTLVQESVAEGSLPENLFANLQEVLNISVGVFPQSNQHRIVIEKISQGEQAVDDYKACEGTPEMSIKLTVERYGEGFLKIGAT